MPTVLVNKAIEKSTFAVDASFFDETDTPVVPNSGLTWTLTTGAGTVINSRTSVSITPATTVTIVLSGNDLALSTTGNDNGERVITIQGTYNSSLGSNLPIKDEVKFFIQSLLYIT